MKSISPNTLFKKHVIVLSATGLLLSLISFNASDAQARGRTVTGSKGGTRSISHSVGSGNFSRSASTTTASGRTRSKVTTGSYADGKASGTQTITRANGSTATRQISAQKTGKGSYTKTVTGENGKSITKDTTLSYDKETGLTKNSTITGPNGKTATKTSTADYDKATGEFTKDSKTTMPDGDIVTHSTEGTYKDGAFSGTQTVTRNGKTKTRDFSGTVTPNP